MALQATKNNNIQLIAAALAVMMSEACQTASSMSRMYGTGVFVLRALGIRQQRTFLLGNGLICVQVLVPQNSTPSAASP